MAEFQTATVELSRSFTKPREVVWEALTDGIAWRSGAEVPSSASATPPFGVVSEETAGTLTAGWTTLLDHLVK